MAIVRPEKPPLLPAQQAVMVAAAQGSASGYTPENMPIDVMTQAPAQPQAPVVVTAQPIPAMPADPATPNLPVTDQRVGPQGADPYAGEQAVVVGDPANAAITTEEVMSDGEGGIDPTGAAVAALVATGVLTAAMRRRMSRTGTTGDPVVDDQVRAAREADARGGIDNIDGSETDGGRSATGDTPDTGRAQGTGPVDGSNAAPATSQTPQQPAAPDAANGPATGDPATSAIGTDDVMPPTDNNMSKMTVIDGEPPNLPTNFEGNLHSTTNSADRTITSYVRNPQGQWYMLDPIQATPQAMRAQREVIYNALRGVRGALR